MPKTVIFTDLDGTLLHPKTYSFEAALPALNLIREKNIPLILCSSKTRAELEIYKKKLENNHPFISENGGGVFIPEGYFSKDHVRLFGYKAVELGFMKKLADYHVVVLGKPYEEIRKTFMDLRQRLNIKVKGFGDITAEDVAELTGLTLEEASLAKLRDFGEPFVFEGAPDERFLNAIVDSGFHWTQGKLHHIMGDNDKGKAVNILKLLFEIEHDRILTIGLGDGFNDLPMLKAVDQPVLIPKEDGMHDHRVSIPNLIKAKGIGPDGWNKAIIELLGRMI
ncbi:MAG TPA: HAD-IIB family hydrolase [Dissulfurispiraceae bacterium]|nr:HAD-IIB family hydrolase [Dissulfurispiraceae bacterium]